MLLFRRGVAMFVATLCLTGVIATPALAESIVRAPRCAAELGLTVPTAKEAAEQTPVVMVHGFTGSPSTWKEGNPSMENALQDVGEIAHVEPFNYHDESDRWVTEGGTAQRLAKTIVCYSKLYGGKRVIVLAHSMGGLLTRAALDWAAYGTFAKKVTGLVITIGAPHKGTGLANVGSAPEFTNCMAFMSVINPFENHEAMCRQAQAYDAKLGMTVNSPELARLPKFPSEVAIKAIAGRVKWQVCAPWGCSQFDKKGDLVVSVESATDEYTQRGSGDGKQVFECTSNFPVANFTKAWCEHSNMVRAPQVQDEVKRSIQEYLTSLNRPQGKLVTTFGHLSFRIPDGLDLKPFHGEGYTSYELMCGDMLGGQNGCPKLSVYNPHEASGSLGWQSWGWKEECGADKPVRSGVLSIGGRSARAYVAGHCRFWEMSDNSALIIATDPPGSKQSGVVDRVVATAMWN